MVRFALRRIVALAATMVLAPAFAYVLFNGLRVSDITPWALLTGMLEFLERAFLHFDLGVSGPFGEPVREIIFYDLVTDLQLLAGGFATGILAGVGAGMWCAAHPRSLPARAAGLLSAIVLSVPPYFLAFVALILFSPTAASLLPLPFVSGQAMWVPFSEDATRWLQAMWVPWLVLGAPLAAQCLRMTTASVREQLGEDFVRTARAKGVRERGVRRRHALPAAAPPVVSLAGVNMATMLTNLALVEVAFNLPGSFRQLLSAVEDNDLPMILGMVIVSAVLVTVASTLADLVHGLLDPRLRL